MQLRGQRNRDKERGRDGDRERERQKDAKSECIFGIGLKNAAVVSSRVRCRLLMYFDY